MGRRDLYAISVTTSKESDGVEIRLCSAVAEAREDENAAALAAFGNPTEHAIDWAAAQAAGLIGRAATSPWFEVDRIDRFLRRTTPARSSPRRKRPSQRQLRMLRVRSELI